MAKSRVVRAFSAGGIVYRPLAGAGEHPASASHVAAGPSARLPAPLAELAEIVLVGRTREGTWTLPKGTPDEGETTQQTALREVREETGIEARIVGEIGSIHYWFARKGIRFNKEVLHYLMEATGGDVTLHDLEYDEARWFPLHEAAERLTYENEAAIVRRAEPMIRRRLASEGAPN